ncbi:hypothetical protein EPA93_21630 [Ktedonosporobacter rubrisoli]|uniref:Uncharacterized protein n=1 Tax=Ktedonosporobacter rubrisoli TaxID=2509675 RepID=A0A4P6JT36_KTERU|nr:hypothetical protein [Ktedonosporobacter rubrisoli]QBD78453.1 hypothetical protein EPA93_21630 [Ktedonosporobacter rubrisoli]
MSYQMPSEGESQRYQSGYSAGELGSSYSDSFGSQQSQKIGQIPSSPSSTIGPRLALAIVSVVMLVPLSAIILLGGSSSMEGFGFIVSRLIALGLVCITIAIINVVFNFKHV